jgi:O-antigen ligase
LIDRLKHNHILITTSLLLVALPYKKIVVLALLLNTISYFFNDSISEKLIRLKRERYLWVFIAPFFMYLIGMIYSENQYFGWKDIETKLSLLIFPLIYSTTSFPLNKYRNTLSMVFVFSMSISSALSIFYGVIMYQKIPTYSELNLLLHPGYLSMYANMAIGLCYLLINSKMIKGYLKKLLTLAFLILSLTVILSLSKTGIIVWIILIAGMFFHQALVLKKQYKKSIIAAVSAIGILFIAYQTIPKVQLRVNKAINVLSKSENEKVDVTTTESTQVRILIWEQAIELIKENFLIGVGTGDIKDELFVKYKSSGMQGALDNRLNVHNQYLQVFATLGIIGFIVFTLAIVLPFLKAIKSKKNPYLIFIVIFSMNLLFESMLEKQGGVLFYAFLNALFFFHFSDISSQFSSKSK